MEVVMKWCLGLAMSVCVLCGGQAAPSGIHLLKAVTLGGDTFWDYVMVDAARHRVFIAHGTHFVIVDSRTGEAIGDIADIKGAHGVAVADRLGKGVAASGKNNTVLVV